MARHRPLHHEHYARMALTEWTVPGANANFTPTADRVYLEPLQIGRMYTADYISLFRGAAWLAAGEQVILGIYADNGDTPTGGALLASTGIVAVLNPNNVIQEVAIGPITLDPGLYWLAQVYDTATGNMLRVFDANADIAKGGTLFSRYYDAGAFVLTDPCPATVDNADTLLSYLLISAIP